MLTREPFDFYNTLYKVQIIRHLKKMCLGSWKQVNPVLSASDRTVSLYYSCAHTRPECQVGSTPRSTGCKRNDQSSRQSENLEPGRGSGSIYIYLDALVIS